MTTREAPAKINLSLRVTGKRGDGYHEVDLLTVRIGLADSLEFANSRTTTLRCDTPGVPVDETNLVMKAVRVFESRYGKKAKQKITLTKRTPHGAGLGGGSSDAASTLLALNDILETGYSLDELKGMAAEIGSDVAFFLDPVPTRCTGRGEITDPVPALAGWSSPAVLLKPDFGASTADIYKRWAESQEMSAFTYASQTCGDLELVNDLERPAYEKFPFLGFLKNWLLAREGVRATLLSGSGSALFALTETLDQAAAIAEAAVAEVNPSMFTWHGLVNPPLALDAANA